MNTTSIKINFQALNLIITKLKMNALFDTLYM